MQTEVLTAKIVNILVRVSGKPESDIGPHSLLRQDLELDSMNLIELDHEIKRSGLPTLPEARLRDLVTVSDIVALVQETLGATSDSER